MKKVFLFLLPILFLSTCLVHAQVPASQDTIVVNGGIDNIGSLENAINGDTTAGAVRINPNRVYKLKKNTVYFVQSPILFGGVNDTSSTLNIIGETGGNLPIILENPKDGGNAFRDIIAGNFTIKNVYWPARALTNSSSDLFVIQRKNRRLIMENVVTEFGGNNLFTFDNGGAKIYLKGCYFRDMNWFQNSWNSCIVTNNGADTVWVENCTVTNTGLGFFLLNTVKFMYFNHNTMVNATKYGITRDQYEEAYFTNNIFVNMNWEGECSGTYYTQDFDHLPKGVTDIDTISADLWQPEQGFVPDENDVKFITSNNIHYTDTALDQYYNGDFTPGYDYPVSNRNWAPWAGDTTVFRIWNIPPKFLSKKTIDLAAAYPNIVIDQATISDGIDPQMHTTGTRSQAVLEAMVRYSQNNYGELPDGVTFSPDDITLVAFGDYDPSTIPGIKTENGQGFTKISDFTEDFSYDANITSTIDGKKLGALTWWSGGLDGWDSQAEFQKVKDYYSKLTSVEKADNTLPSAYSLSQNYPNPFNPTTVISFSVPKAGNVLLKVYNSLGQEVATLVNEYKDAANYKVNFDASRLSSGVYFYTLKVNNFTESKKMMLIK